VSIDLICHLNCSLAEATQILEKVSNEHTDLFAKKFLIWGPNKSNDIKKEIAAEYGFDSQNYFGVGLNLKDESARLKEVANLMRSTFGEDRILVLFENEEPF
jgi:hypothetical protein